MEKRFSGLRFVTVKGLNTGTLDVSNNGYGFKVINNLNLKRWNQHLFLNPFSTDGLIIMSTLQVGLEGEKLRIFSEEGVKKVKWSSAMGTQPITWYKVSTNVLLSIASLRTRVKRFSSCNVLE